MNLEDLLKLAMWMVITLVVMAFLVIPLSFYLA